jgi:hypothetical protein
LDNITILLGKLPHITEVETSFYLLERDSTSIPNGGANLTHNDLTNEEWIPVYEEIKRKHERLDTRWNSLDAKIGVILGFTVVVLFQVILSSDISGFAVTSTASTNFVLTCVGRLLFVDAVISLVAASIVGFYAFRLVQAPETPLEKWIKEIDDNPMKVTAFPAKVAWNLYNWYPLNKALLARKTMRFQAMFYLFLVGVAFFLARFVVIFISNVFP